jgi:serine/threonine protein kinase
MVTQFFATGDTSSSDALLERLRTTTAGLYDVAGEIGRGGMAVVYIATDMRLGRKVAIKVMEPRLSFTPGMAERFLQEARIAAQLQHHNIIVVHEVQQDAELIFFVMRLVEGGSLDEVCRRLAKQGRTLPLDQAQWILWQSARALAYAHSEGIVHRDVKPANILVTTKGEVVVTDFGIAKAADGEGLTKSGMAIGTPVYMSPEQFTGTEPVSGAADQYALGIAAYELLAGAPPFTGDLYRLIAAHGNTVPPHLREVRPDCPAPLADAIMRMLEKKPSDRWPSLDALLPVLGTGLSIDGSSTRSGLAEISTELQTARESAVAAWAAMAPRTPAWTSGSRRRGPIPSAVSVSPPGGEVLVGATLDLRAVVTSESGATVGDATVTWTSSDPAVATVTPEGSVTGVAVGGASIRAQVSSGSGASTGLVQTVVSITVAARSAARVRIAQGELSLECGEATQLTAEAFDVLGAAVVSPQVTWSSSDPSVLHVDSRGTIMALAGGLATVTARVGEVQGTTRVEVREAPVGSVKLLVSESECDIGAVLSLELQVLDVSGIPRSADGLVVLSDRPAVLQVQSAPLALRALEAGSATIRVVNAEPGKSGVAAPWGTATVTVRAAAVVEPVVVAPVVPVPAPAPAAPIAAPPAVPKPAPVVAPAPAASVATQAPTAASRSNGRLIGLGAGGLLVAVALFMLTRGSESPSDSDVAPVRNDSVSIDSGTARSSSVAATAPDTETPAPATDPDPVPSAVTAETSPPATRPAPPTAATQRAADPVRAEAGRAETRTPPPPSTRTVETARPEASGAADAASARPPATAVESAPTPAPVVEAGPSDEDARALAFQYTARLLKGEFRDGELASFFSRTTTAHKAAVGGGPRVVSRQGNTMVVDVDVALERTMGSGAVNRRATTVRLVLSGRPGATVIERATPGPLQNPR